MGDKQIGTVFDDIDFKNDMTIDRIFGNEPSLLDQKPEEPLTPATPGNLNGQGRTISGNRPAAPEPVEEAAR
jgi:hypothetical protein